MKRIGRTEVAKLAAGMLIVITATTTFAEKENRYLTIADRNAFGLVEPPPPAPTPAPPEAPKPVSTVRLTGITTLFSKAKALFEIMEAPGKDMQKPIMTVGDRVGDVELVSIDVENKQVTVKHAGTVTNLVLEAQKAPATPTRGMPPGIRPGIRPPGLKVPTPRTRTAATTRAPSPVVTRGSSSRGGVVVGGFTPPAPAAPIRTIPTRVTRTQAAAPTEPIDPAKQILQLKLNELKARQEGRIFPPSPPIPGLDMPPGN